jgi:glycosyl transferase family 25
MIDEIDCAVVSLLRTNRRAAFLERNKATKINFIIFDAIDGDTLCSSEVEDLIKPGTQLYTPGSLGCAKSHLTLWQRCLVSGKPLVIFEDDAVIREDFKRQIARLLYGRLDWHIVLLGYNFDAAVEIEISPRVASSLSFSTRYPSSQQLSEFAASENSVELYPLLMAWGGCGYAISPEGARVLIDRCFPMDNRTIRIASHNSTVRAYSIDSMMNSCYPEILAFACVAPLVMTPNDPVTSNTRRGLAAHIFA